MIPANFGEDNGTFNEGNEKYAIFARPRPQGDEKCTLKLFSGLSRSPYDAKQTSPSSKRALTTSEPLDDSSEGTSQPGKPFVQKGRCALTVNKSFLASLRMRLVVADFRILITQN